MYEQTTLTSPNGGSILLTKEAKDALGRIVQADGQKAEDEKHEDVGRGEVQIWYGDPAEHAHAYLAITREDNGVLVRDGMDETGAALSFSNEQWAALAGGDAALGKPEGDREHPAEVTNPNDLNKVPDRGGKNKSHS